MGLRHDDKNRDPAMLVSDLILLLAKCPLDWDITLQCGQQYYFPVAVEPRADAQDRTVFILDKDVVS